MVGKATRKFETAIACLTDSVRRAVLEHIERVGIGECEVNEIRLRAPGVCALSVRGENIPLGVTVDQAQLREIMRRVTGGALFAHRDDMCRGFVSLPLGVRVGVVGHARYEGGAPLGITDISSLVFRIPSGECSFADSLYADWLAVGGGMLICSPAGEGKTTAIRSLARLIGSGERPLRVAVVDERCELDPSEYEEAHVDILRGYRRALGVDIAVRTLSAEVLIVDEISGECDADAMLAALGAGVTVIATAHATGLCDAVKRGYIARLVAGGLFESVCVISRSGARFSYRLERISDDRRG